MKKSRFILPFAACVFALGIIISCSSNSIDEDRLFGGDSSSSVSMSGNIFCQIGAECSEMTIAACIVFIQQGLGSVVPECPEISSSSTDGSSNSNPQSSSSVEDPTVNCQFSGNVCSPMASSLCALGGGSAVAACPNGSSSSAVVQSSSGAVQPSSSSTIAQSSSSELQPSSSSVAAPSSSSMQIPTPSICDDPMNNKFCDTRDDKLYKYALVASNTKTIMTENLNYSANNTIGYCYGGSILMPTETTCPTTYGRHYAYNEVSDAICPDGWRLPTAAELKSYYSSSVETYGGNYNKNTDWPIGWNDATKYGFYWTATPNTIFKVFHNKSSATEVLTDLSNEIFSARCITDVALYIKPTKTGSLTCNFDYTSNTYYKGTIPSCAGISISNSADADCGTVDYSFTGNTNTAGAYKVYANSICKGITYKLDSLSFTVVEDPSLSCTWNGATTKIVGTAATPTATWQNNYGRYNGCTYAYSGSSKFPAASFPRMLETLDVGTVSGVTATATCTEDKKDVICPDLTVTE